VLTAESARMLKTLVIVALKLSDQIVRDDDDYVGQRAGIVQLDKRHFLSFSHSLFLFQHLFIYFILFPFLPGACSVIITGFYNLSKRPGTPFLTLL
jgi:hypothetical protein